MNWWQQPFVQVALPIIVTFAIATWFQSKRIDDLRDSLGRRIDELRDSMNHRFDVVERRLERIDRRITVLEERTSPLHR
jgi:hypothetical protein